MKIKILVLLLIFNFFVLTVMLNFVQAQTMLTNKKNVKEIDSTVVQKKNKISKGGVSLLLKKFLDRVNKFEESKELAAQKALPIKQSPKSVNKKKIKKMASKIIGSCFTEFEYVDIDDYTKNTSYDRGSTYRLGFVGLGNIGETKFSGMMITSYNNLLLQKNVEFESLRFEFSKKNRNLLIGQFYPQYSEFTISNQKIEGIKFTITDKIVNSEITHDFFFGISNQYEKITEMNTNPEYQQYLYGSRLQYTYRKNNTLNVTIFKAKDDNDSIDTGTPTFGLIDNDVFGFEYCRKLLKERGIFIFEYTKTSLDKHNNQGKLDDSAIKYFLNYNLKKNLITSLQFKEFGKKYYTAGYTSLNSSEVGYKGLLFNYEYELNKFSFQGFLEGYSEYSYDTSEIGIDYRLFNNILNYKISSKEKVTFTTYFKKTEKRDKTIDKLKSSFKLGYSIRKKKRRLGIKTDYSKTDDKTIGNSDVITKSLSLTYNNKFFKNKLTLSSFLLGSITSLESGNTKFYMANANINTALIPRKLVVLGASSYKMNVSSTETTRTYTNKLEFKYYLTLKNSLKLILKNDRKLGGNSEYNVNNIVSNLTFLF